MSKLLFDLLSDTHNRHSHFKCPGGDFLLHAGDCTSSGKLHEALPFLDWFAKQDYSHLIMIPGNHDWCFENQPSYMAKECKDRGIILLNDSGYEAEGIKFWGSPVQPWFHDWAFNRRRGDDIKRHWDMIPQDTEVLITHGPPAGFGDEVTTVSGAPYNPPQRVGCDDLLQTIQKSQVRLHVSGHIHEGRGFIYDKEVTYVNASSLDRMYYPVGDKPMRATREVAQDGSVIYVL